MKSDRRKFIASSTLMLGALSLPVYAEQEDKFEARTSVVRGRVVCLTEELQKLYQVVPDCEKRGHTYSIKTAEGKIVPLLPTDTAAAVWMDQRYRERELQVTVRAFPQTDFVEVINFQSWLNGKLYDLYYFCDVCMIYAHKPGPCECCQEPVQFRETPAEK